MTDSIDDQGTFDNMDVKNSNNYRYDVIDQFRFNGKELDTEGMGGGLSTYDYGFRIYNAALGKFLSVDPLLLDFPELSTYQFASNTPIIAIDLDGLEAVNHTQVKDMVGNGSIKVTRDLKVLVIIHNYNGQVTKVSTPFFGDDHGDLDSKWNSKYAVERISYGWGGHHGRWEEAAEDFAFRFDTEYNVGADWSPKTGGQGLVNVFRHQIGQAAIAATYGADFAEYAGTAHERPAGTGALPAALDVDRIADLLNNHYARELGLAWKQEIGGDAGKATAEQVAKLMNQIGNYVIEASPEFQNEHFNEFSPDDQIVRDVQTSINSMAN